MYILRCYRSECTLHVCDATSSNSEGDTELVVNFAHAQYVLSTSDTIHVIFCTSHSSWRVKGHPFNKYVCKGEILGVGLAYRYF